MAAPIQVLIIEDNLGDVEMTREALERSKYDIELTDFHDGIEAVEYLNGEGEERDGPTPDLILLDLNLPRMNGCEVLKAIRSMPHLKHIPVVIMTSSDAENDVISSYELGANCYVTKPTGFAAYQEILLAIHRFWFTVARVPVT